jgi:hypothetical protein
MAKAKGVKKNIPEKNDKDSTEESVHISSLKIKSEATGNLITEGDPEDPNLHDGQAWREGRSVDGSK